MQKNLKILYIITLSDLGGAQTHLLEVVMSLQPDNDIIIIVGSTGWLTDRVDEITVHYIVEPSLVREISLVKDIKAICSIKNIINKVKPDIVHCHSSKAGIVGRIAAKLAGVPVVFTAHGWAFTDGVKFIKRLLFACIERIMLLLTVKVICVSDYDRKLAERWFKFKSDKIITIHNGVIESDLVKNNFNLNLVSLIMVARFSAQKNQKQLIEAVKDVIDDGYRVKCTLVGDGSNYIECLEYIKQNNLGNNISLLGLRNDIDELLLQNDVFCLISNYEGLPISIIEAMRAGLPVIASNVGGVNELVNDGVNGYLIPKGDKQLLKQRIIEIISEPEKLVHMGQASRNKYEREYSAQQMISGIVDVYREVIKK